MFDVILDNLFQESKDPLTSQRGICLESMFTDFFLIMYNKLILVIWQT